MKFERKNISFLCLSLICICRIGKKQRKEIHLITDISEIKKADIRLIAIDLDGTMLTQEKKVTEHTKEVLLQAERHGILIVPSTGRHFHGIPEEVIHLEGVRYFLTMNGAAIYDKKWDNYLYEDVMPCDFALRILKELMQYDILVDAFIRGYAYRTETDIRYIKELQIPDTLKEFMQKSRKEVPSLYDYIKDNRLDVHKFTLNFKPDGHGDGVDRNKVLQLAEREKGLTCVCGGFHNLELTNVTATKGNALLQLSELLGIRREQVMAIGDSENDFAMLKAAGIGVAMKNADANVQKAADFVTRSNEEDGVAYIIEQYLSTFVS